MTTVRETLKAELMAAAEAAIEEILTWEDTPTATPHTFADIETTAVQARQAFGRRVTEILLHQEPARRPVPGPRCPTCQREMHYKGEQPHWVGSLVGEIQYRRGYYYCEHCHQGFFPPR